jgi:hypothetical protein
VATATSWTKATIESARWQHPHASSTVGGNGRAGCSGDGGAATSAELNGLTGVAADAAANIDISDPSNNRIRSVRLLL